MKAVFDPAFGVRHNEPVALRACYRRNRRQDPVASVAALAFVGLLGSAFAFMSPVFVKKQVEKPVVVSLLEMPQDPPPEQPQPDLDQPVPPQPTQVVTPPPLVAVPTVAPVIQQVEVAKPAPPAPQVAPAPPAPPVQTGPVNGGDLSAQVLFRKPIRVPLESRRQHEEGIVVLSLLLSPDGRVADISVVTSSGFPRLDRAAMDAVRDWRWSPLTRNGAPVMVRGQLRVPFIRDNGPGGRDGRGRGGRHGRGPDGRDDDGLDGGDRT